MVSYRFDVCVSIGRPRVAGEYALQLAHMFGIRHARPKKEQKILRASFDLPQGAIALIVGASGAGKSLLLQALWRQAPARLRVRLDDVPLESDTCTIDAVADAAVSLDERLAVLNKAGLSDVFCMLRPPAQLSTGQQARYRLAKALAGDRALLFADEFTASMDRITALAAAHHLRKTISRSRKSCILASCHDDIIDELRPGIVINCPL